MHMKIGIALSGGGARGLAHLGVLAGLLEKGIQPQVIAGTSAGAVIGALYAAGLHPAEILEQVIASGFPRCFRLSFNRYGLFRMEEAEEILRRLLGGKETFEGLQRHLSVATTDITHGRVEFFSTGDLIRPLLASCCIPLLFCPITINDVRYVDGGLLNNLPVEPLLSTDTYIIGVNVSPYQFQRRITSIKSVVERNMQMALYSSTEPRVGQCHCYLSPPGIGAYSLYDFKKARHLYLLGYEYATKQELSLPPAFSRLARAS